MLGPATIVRRCLNPKRPVRKALAGTRNTSVDRSARAIELILPFRTTVQPDKMPVLDLYGAGYGAAFHDGQQGEQSESSQSTCAEGQQSREEQASNWSGERKSQPSFCGRTEAAARAPD